MEWYHLRVRAVFQKTVRVCHVYCNFKLGFKCRITVIFEALKDGRLLINTLVSNICFSCRNMFQNGVDALIVKNSWCLFVKKLKILSSSDYPKLFKICYPVAQTLTKELQMTFQTVDVSICNSNMKYPIEASTFSHLILRSSSFMFPLLLITVEVKNTICNSLITMFTTSWRNLIKIGWSELYKIWAFFTKSCSTCYPF